MRGARTRSCGVLALLGAALLVADAARAEFITPPAPLGFASTPARVNASARGAPSAAKPVVSESVAVADWSYGLCHRVEPDTPTRCPPLDAAQCAPGRIADLPPPPSSLALGLTALAGLGAFQAGRSLRRLSWSQLPDWYHTDAPQVGHATPLDLDNWDLPPCLLDEPIHLPSTTIAFASEVVACWPSDLIPPLAAPRGPPLPT